PRLPLAPFDAETRRACRCVNTDKPRTTNTQGVLRPLTISQVYHSQSPQRQSIPMSTVYLIHFNQKYHHAGHYIGLTDDLDARLECHTSGNGARLMEVITSAGITWQLARTW